MFTQNLDKDMKQFYRKVTDILFLLLPIAQTCFDDQIKTQFSLYFIKANLQDPFYVLVLQECIDQFFRKKIDNLF